ncbi:MAG: Ig-like domain-containing protein [Gammaproteobacteria bacterium]|nr:Ig-like domain-containing protein [Gammaproteobacteria bacterium]
MNILHTLFVIILAVFISGCGGGGDSGNGGGDANQNPVAVDDSANTEFDSPVTVDVLANDSDADGDTLTITEVSVTPNNGNAVINGGTTITYTPHTGFSGSDSFQYSISDGNGGTGTATVSVTVAPNTNPVANDDSAETAFNTAVTVNVLTNDTDVNGDSLSVTAIAVAPGNGTAVINGGATITYTPNTGFSGSDSFQYSISDGNGGTGTATVTVTVAPNTNPVATDDSAETAFNTAVTVNVLTNDTDVNGDSLSVTAIAVAPGNGTAVINGGATITYTPNTGFSGSDSFQYSISDGNGGTGTATVTVTVAPNTNPVANDDSANTGLNSAVTINVLVNDSDADGDSLTVTEVTQPTNGSATISNDGSNVSYTPNNGYSGTDSFTYTISDGNGGTAGATVNITINVASGPYNVYTAGSTIYAVDEALSPVPVAQDLFDTTGKSLNHTNSNIIAINRMSLAAGTVSFHEPSLLLYAGANNLWKMDLAVGSDLTPTALLAQNYSDLCAIETDVDNLLVRAQVFYELPGADNSCTDTADNTRWMFGVTKSQNSTPVEITGYVDQLSTTRSRTLVTVGSINGGAISVSGFIAVSGNEIRHYNTDFSSHSVVTMFSDLNSIDLEYDFDQDGGFMLVDRSLYWYSTATSTLSASRFDMLANTSGSSLDCDHSECFFFNRDASNVNSDANFYRLPSDGSAAASTFYTVTGGMGDTHSSVVTADDYIIAKGNTGELIAINRTTPAIRTLDTGTDGFVIGVNQKLYYNARGNAVIRNFNGTSAQEFSNAAWVGSIYSGFNITNSTTLNDRLILAKQAAGQTTLANATLESINPATDTVDVQIGTLPANTDFFYSFGFNANSVFSTLWTATPTPAGGISYNADIVWFRATGTANTLTNVTNSTAIETLVDPD